MSGIGDIPHIASSTYGSNTSTLALGNMLGPSGGTASSLLRQAMVATPPAASLTHIIDKHFPIKERLLLEMVQDLFKFNFPGID